jgi:hypothetical protein
MSFSLASSSVHLTSFQGSQSLPLHTTASPTSPIYSLAGAIEVIPLSSLPLGHLEGTYSGKINSSMRSFCRMGFCRPSNLTENSLREEYWHHLLNLTNSEPIEGKGVPASVSSTAVSLQDTISYIPSSLWLNSSFYVQKGFTGTLSFTTKQLEKTIDYLNRYPMILEGLLDTSTASSATLDDSPMSNLFLGRELLLSHPQTTTQPKELFLGTISCCVFSGNVSSRHKTKKHSIGRSLPSISIFEAMGVTLPGSIHLGVSYHGMRPPTLLASCSHFPFPSPPLCLHSEKISWEGRCGIVCSVVYHLSTFSHRLCSQFFINRSEHILVLSRVSTEHLIVWTPTLGDGRDPIVLWLSRSVEGVLQI